MIAIIAITKKSQCVKSSSFTLYQLVLQAMFLLDSSSFWSAPPTSLTPPSPLLITELWAVSLTSYFWGFFISPECFSLELFNYLHKFQTSFNPVDTFLFALGVHEQQHLCMKIWKMEYAFMCRWQALVSLRYANMGNVCRHLLRYLPSGHSYNIPGHFII